MSDQFIGEIRAFPFDFAPFGWALCAGQLLPISQYTALFSLLGTFYGGNGVTNFALPDLRGRASMAPGQGSGLTQRVVGETGGEETVTLLTQEMPPHSHLLSAGGTVGAKNAAGDSRGPAGAVPAGESSGVTATYSNASADSSMKAGGVTFGGTATAATVGGSVPHDNRQPFVTLNYCIALEGVFPSRP